MSPWVHPCIEEDGAKKWTTFSRSELFVKPDHVFTLPANRVLLFTFLSLLNIIRIVINFCIRAPPLQPLSKYASQKLQVTSHRNSFKDSPKEFSFFLHTLVLLYYPIYMYVYGVGHNMCVIGREKARSTMAKVKCILSRVYIYILGPHRMWYPFPYQSTNKSIWYTAVQSALIHGLCPPHAHQTTETRGAKSRWWKFPLYVTSRHSEPQGVLQAVTWPSKHSKRITL